MKKNSYIGITFIILIFGIWAIPKIIDNMSKKDLLKFEQVPPFEFIDQNKKYSN